MSAETIIARGAMVYASALGAQTAQALAAIDRLLAMAGTDKSKLLTAKVRLADMSLLETHTAEWRVRDCSPSSLPRRPWPAC